jgi:hypothetical protein
MEWSRKQLALSLCSIVCDELCVMFDEHLLLFMLTIHEVCNN